VPLFSNKISELTYHSRHIAAIRQVPLFCACARQSDFQARLATAGFEVMGGSTAEAQNFLRTELTKWARVVKETGAKAD